MTGNYTNRTTDYDRDLLSVLDAQFARFSSRPALRREGEGGASVEVTYDDLRARIAAMTTSLRAHGIGPGSRVALLCENRPAWVIALLGAWHAGATVIPLDPKLGISELAVLLGHAQPRVVLSSPAHRDRARDAARSAGVGTVIALDESTAAAGDARGCDSVTRAAEDTALIIYTSGTTGEPKGVAIGFSNLHHQVRTVNDVIGREPREHFLSILPLCHLYELICGLLVPLVRGATISYPADETLLPRELTRIMRERRITSLVGVPLLYRALARGIEAEVARASRVARWLVKLLGAIAMVVPVRIVRRWLHAPVLRKFGGHLRALYAGGAALDPQVASVFERMGLPIFEGYGLSETSPVVATNSSRRYRRGSVGLPLPGTEVRIVDGEIQTRGPHVMQGYVDRPDLTANVMSADGWFRTGDLGRIDRDGYLYVTGRAKDVIVLGGGKKVYPDEVEHVLAANPAFAEVCVLGVPSRHNNEVVCAVVVPTRPSAKELDAEVARTLAGIAAFKRPTRVVVRREPIPRTTTRKAKRSALAAWIRNRNDLEHAA